MNRPIGIAAVFALVAAVGCAPALTPASAQQASGTLFFDGGRLIVGDGSVIESAAFVVEDGRIGAVGRSDEVTAPAGATRVDLTGKTVMPAIIAGHVHVGFENYMGWGADRYTRENILDNLNRMAYYGIAAAYSPGTDPHDLAFGIQRDQAAGRVGGARLVFAAGMAAPGMGPNQNLLNAWRETGAVVVRGVADEQDAAVAVREVAAKGIPFIKVWVDERGGTQQKLPPSHYRALVAEAKRQGIPVHAHQGNREDMLELARAGVAGFLHGRLSPEVYDDEMIRVLVQNGTFVVPNIGIGEIRRRANQFDDPFFQEAVGAAVIQRLRSEAPAPNPPTAAEDQLQREALAKMLAAGVEIMLGSDAGAVPNHYFGYADHKELEIYIRLGMTPMQAIIAATSTPAKNLGLTDLGTVATGKSADLLILDANPLDAISNTQRIADVYLKGQRLDRAAMRARWKAAEAGN